MAQHILEYIKENIDNINEFHQDGVEWINYYKKTLESEETKQNNDFTSAIKLIKESLPEKSQKLNRTIVKKLYSDVYSGFIATLLWGHIFPVHLQTIISTPKSKILSKLNRMFTGLNEDSSEHVFKMMMKEGDYHIDGIGVSFFTKIFYFTSHIHGHNNFLILDGKMWNVYNAFLKANGKDVKKYKVNNCQYEDYMQYCDYMHRTSVKSPDQLEAFLFAHNNEVKSFLEQGNTHSKKDQRVKTIQPTNHNTKDNNSIWKAYKLFDTFKGNTSGMEFIKPGYCLPLRNKAGEIEHYRIFVAKHTGKKYEGLYFCELMRGWREKGIIDENPDAYKIFNEFPSQTSKLYNKVITISKQRWYNNKKEKSNARMYRYITFDNTVSKEDVIDFMKKIIDFVQNTLKR